MLQPNVLSGTDEALNGTTTKKFNAPLVEEAYGDANRVIEGYAFAGINMKDCIVFNRLLDLREDGLLEGKD